MQELSEERFVWHESVTNGYFIILVLVWFRFFSNQKVWLSSVVKYRFGVFFPVEIHIFYCFIQGKALAAVGINFNSVIFFFFFKAQSVLFVSIYTYMYIHTFFFFFFAFAP